MSNSARPLRVTFDSEDEFRKEYASNIASGGIFIATNAGFDVRDAVSVELSLDYRDEKLVLEGEIVRVIGAELEGSGASPGVAVQFNLKASEVRRQLDPLVGSAAEDERAANAACRVQVRIPARLRTPESEELDARTRDLSTSGVLLVEEGDPVDVNEKVHGMSTHPGWDQEIELAGTEMRHLRSPSGGPTATGVRFDIPKSERSAIESLLGEFQARADPETFQGDPVSLDAAMLDATRLFDESQRFENVDLPENAELCVDPEKLETAADELSQVEEAIVELAEVGLSVAKVIEVIPEPDTEIRQRIAGLIERGLISLGE